ncbi:hypothetical protein TNCV_1229831 [Trichonephila clavipes]|nr:hypothetical protein TNCV_1229831 [Trichonephila clavipes]
MHWRHRFPMLFNKLSDTGIGSEDQTQSLEIELAIPFVPNRDPPDTSNNPSSVRSCVPSIRMKSLPTAAAYGRTYGSKGLIPISKTSYGSSMEHKVRWWPPSEIPCPNQVPPL